MGRPLRAHRIGSPAGQAAYLTLLPVVVGAIMAAIGGWGRRRRLLARTLDRSWYGFLFALAIGIVGHCTAH
jgi:hypothetical protein